MRRLRSERVDHLDWVAPDRVAPGFALHDGLASVFLIREPAGAKTLPSQSALFSCDLLFRGRSSSRSSRAGW